MPLYKRKPFPLLEPPEDLNALEFVYQIRFTKEILRDYQEYLNRLNLYRQRVWACKVTGKTNLTYEEALVSERHAAEKVQQFPKELMAPVLHMIQYSNLTLKDLVNEIYTKLQEHVFEGLELHGRKEQSVCACKILKVLEDGVTTQYKVGWIDKDKKITCTSIVNAEDLIRKKPPFSRNVLKAFIRESTSQSTPWLVHEKLAEKYGISTEPSDYILQNGLRYSSRESKKGWQNMGINHKRKQSENGNMAGNMIKKKAKKEEKMPNKELVKYPIDDLLVRPAADDPIADRPPLSSEFSVPMECIGDLLMVWDFCSSFSRLLHLWPFTLEDFENAIRHKESNLTLIVETHSAILRLLIKDKGNYVLAIQKKKRKSKITLIKWTEFLCDFLEMEDRPELSSYVPTIRRGHYGLLDTPVKLRVLRELVLEALTTNAIRARLDECIERQQTIAAMRREETRKKEKEQSLKESDTKEVLQGHLLENGKGNTCKCNANNVSIHCEVHSSKRNHMPRTGERKRDLSNSREIAKARLHKESSAEKIKNVSATKQGMTGQRRRKDKDKETREKHPEEDRREHLESEIEKLSIRTNSLGKDRNYNRYWFFRREGRLFVESSDSKNWGYYATKEELDGLMGSLNPKGERERALQRHLEKNYLKISKVLQKRSRDIAQKILLEEAVLRRSTRVRAQPREGLAFLRYVNKWKET